MTLLYALIDVADGCCELAFDHYGVDTVLVAVIRQEARVRCLANS